MMPMKRAGAAVLAGIVLLMSLVWAGAFNAHAETYFGGMLGGALCTEELIPGFHFDSVSNDAGWLAPRIGGSFKLTPASEDASFRRYWRATLGDATAASRRRAIMEPMLTRFGLMLLCAGLVAACPADDAGGTGTTQDEGTTSPSTSMRPFSVSSIVRPRRSAGSATPVIPLVAALVAQAGARVEAQYWLLGEYDGLVVVSAPEEDTVIALAAAFGIGGGPEQAAGGPLQRVGADVERSVRQLQAAEPQPLRLAEVQLQRVVARREGRIEAQLPAERRGR